MSTGHIGSKIPSASSDLQWTEDPNSPASFSGSNSYTFTLSGEYDKVRVNLHNLQNATSNNDSLTLRVNGDSTTNYAERQTDGTTSTADQQWAIANLNSGRETPLVELTLTGRWPNRLKIHNRPMVGPTLAGLVHWGEQTSVTSPLDSITLLSFQSNNFSVDVEAFGRDLG